MSFKTSKGLTRLALSKDHDELHDVCDSSCILISDASRLEVFEMGFDLAVEAEDQDVWIVKDEDNAWFFIGTLEDVTAKLKDLPDGDGDSEPGDNEDDSGEEE